MGQATPIADRAGIGAKGIELRINQPRGKRKCKPDRFCEGFNALIGIGINEQGSRLSAAVDGPGGGVDAVGFLVASSDELCVFNFCPNCGERFKLPANK
jgi:hypothetical protein